MFSSTKEALDTAINSIKKSGNNFQTIIPSCYFYAAKNHYKILDDLIITNQSGYNRYKLDFKSRDDVIKFLTLYHLGNGDEKVDVCHKLSDKLSVLNSPSVTAFQTCFSFNKRNIKEIKLDEDNKIMFRVVGKESFNEIKITKLIKNFNPSVEDYVLENISNTWKFITGDIEFEKVSGEDIRKYYSEDSYDFDCELGILDDSCMRYSKCQDYFDLYVNNPSVCSMIIVKSKKDLIVGRALLWETDRGQYLDRPYAADFLISAYEEYARKNGMLYYGDEEGDLIVKLQNTKYDKYPYLDSFGLSEDETGLNSDDYSYCLDSINGNLDCSYDED